MRKLLLFISVIAFSSCEKEDNYQCAECYLNNGQLFRVVCPEDLNGMTVQEYVDYWSGNPNFTCQLVD